ncbi:class I SAM-dependent methyltransferase [Photobacterium galatheae]|uniref:Methyltransferase type 12 domain-containing protein n=1 Tax=Photobacterium galatheae TaxID=1654360 RepID=A0A066RVP9_9GAMM|nr:class I SAM-dependent methyltransferase [Photobacterium galatheae]KDM91757.1 hypothetical protein EA58_09605 [Photobacterium galatheae]MCM0147150.1 class I SAM-dependent methyltransferase [Photobacterium galatheae]
MDNTGYSEALENYIHAHEKLEMLAVHLMAYGIEKVKNKKIATSNPAIEKLYRACQFALQHAGLLSAEPGASSFAVNVSRVKPLNELAALKQECLALSPSIDAHIKLLLHCAEHLPAVLIGRCSGLEVLFPGGEATLVSRAYQGNVLQDYLHNSLAEAVCHSLRDANESKKILEVGAGTCAATTAVLQKLSLLEQPPELWISDISPSLVNAARQQYSAVYPFTHYGVLDIEQPHFTQPSQEPLCQEPFDLIYASNVLHATSDIHMVLKNLVSQFKPGGKLIINELVRFSAFTTMTFGLTPGWWLFQDAMRIEHSPLLNETGWSHALSDAGFQKIAFYYPALNDRVYSGQALISCEWLP